MNSKVYVGAAVVALGLLSQAALADHRHHSSRGDRGRDYGSDYARVIDVQPLVERVRYSVPVEQCWTEDRYRQERRPDRFGATVVGGALGAIVGSGIGHGDGRRAATLGGALAGAVVGSEIARNDPRRGYREARYEEVQRCNTRNEERFDERVTAYRVTYEYNGRRDVAQLPYDPGRFLRVSVDVHPLR
jgi:uncharacterized protein YcfJ